MNILLKIIPVEQIISHLVGLFTKLSSSQWRVIRDFVLQAATTLPNKDGRLEWVKKQVVKLAESRGWKLSDGDINWGIETAVKLLKFLKIIK